MCKCSDVKVKNLEDHNYSYRIYSITYKECKTKDFK